MLVDGGSSLNLISTHLMSKFQISEDRLLPTGPFQGISPGTTKPVGKILLPVTFGTKEMYRIVNIMFDVANLAMPYNGILGRPTLAKFMAVVHHAYNSLKMPTLWGVLTVKANTGDAVACVQQSFQSITAAASRSKSSWEDGDSDEEAPGKKARLNEGPTPGETRDVGLRRGRRGHNAG